MIGVSKLAKAFGDRTLFEGASFQLNAGSRYSLVGANDSGKTTLRIVAGDEPATDGTVSIPKTARVGVLRQDRFLDDESRSRRSSSSARPNWRSRRRSSPRSAPSSRPCGEDHERADGSQLHWEVTSCRRPPSANDVPEKK